MIVADRRPTDEVIANLEGYARVLVLGCNTCVSVCEVGGPREANLLAATLRLQAKLAGREVTVGAESLERQCDHEFIDLMDPYVKDYDAVVSLACGVGVQLVAERHPKLPVFPGVNTLMMGATRERGVWAEGCQGCGSCVLDRTGGICPVTRCAKRIFNGPCGGSSDGRCEISGERDCAWHLIIERLKGLGRLDDYEKIAPLKDWSTARDGGPRVLVREDLHR